MFKIGDQVICKEQDWSGFLKECVVYTVENVGDDMGIANIKLEGIPRYWSPWRFNLFKTDKNEITITKTSEEHSKECHIKTIEKGEFGQLYKIYEEIEDLKAAEDQGAVLMILQKLSDLMGSVDGYLKNHHPTINFNDLLVMKNITTRSFSSGDIR